jgi:hypothetical protein
MNKFGFDWPPSFECEKFPQAGGLCVGENRTANAPPAGSGVGVTPTGTHDGGVRTPSYALPNATFQCPAMLSVTNLREASEYHLDFGRDITPQCAFPCAVDHMETVQCLFY